MRDDESLEAMREAAREVLRELVPEMLHEALSTPPANGHGTTNGHSPVAAPSTETVIPMVPEPPTAAVLRPSTWTGPAVPGEVVGDGAPGAERPDADVEPVTLDSDDDLDRFVRSLLSRFENPRDRRDIRSGRVRFTLRGTRAPSAGAGAAVDQAPGIRVEKGAVTERTVRQAAAQGARLVLARRAVLTPLARDQARALGVQIEREGR
jgi:hypothetical protein